MAKQQTTKQQQINPWCNGDIGTQLGAGFIDIGPIVWATDGITKTNSTTLTIVTPGVYYIAWEQLIQPGGGSGYFAAYKNTVTQLNYAYIMGGAMRDYGNHCLHTFVAGDTVRLHRDVAISSAWGAGHANFLMFLVKGT